MYSNDDNVSDRQKEACAIMLAQRVAEKISHKKNISFEDALELIVNSNCYDLLFDYDNYFWAEGPDYIINFFDLYS